MHEAFARGGDERADLLKTLHVRLQGTLDALNRELARVVDPLRRPNLLQPDQPPLA